MFVAAIIHVCAQQPGDAGQKLIREKCIAVHASLPMDRFAVKNYPILFDSIEVVDYRSDTSRIGIVGTKPRTQKEILFHRPVNQQLSAYLNAGYTNARGGYRLLVTIRDLWVSNATNAGYSAFDEPFFDLSFRLEAYLRVQNEYVPITLLDTVVTEPGRTASFMASRIVPALVSRFMDKVADHDLDVDIVARKTISYHQVDSFCRSRYDYPMDTATVLVKGVYSNVGEFLDNHPFVTQYRLSKDRGANLTLSTPDGQGHFV
ncbi:MAG TPA: hypothetical protein VG605_23165, partial [Puia sp.]|nr:hypothetical protein [Puia sp.]